MTVFHVGQMVVCVGMGEKHDPIAVARWSKIGGVFPKVADVYAIRAIDVWPEVTLLRLVEIDNSHLRWARIEPGFNALAFRPLIDTDISIFTAMLAPTPRREPASSFVEHGHGD